MLFRRTVRSTDYGAQARLLTGIGTDEGRTWEWLNRIVYLPKTPSQRGSRTWGRRARVDDGADRKSGSCSLEQQSRRLTQFQARDLNGTEQSPNNSLPNTTYHQVLTRATGTKNPRVQSPALRC